MAQTSINIKLGVLYGGITPNSFAGYEARGHAKAKFGVRPVELYNCTYTCCGVEQVLTKDTLLRHLRQSKKGGVGSIICKKCSRDKLVKGNIEEKSVSNNGALWPITSL